MALTRCKECGAQISDTARACPQCGHEAPPKAKRKLRTYEKIIIGVVAVVVLGDLVWNGNPVPPHEPKAPSQADLELTAAVRVAKSIKAAMKNPASFDLVALRIYPGGATCYEYRATNSFNAVVSSHAVYLPAKNEVLLEDKDGDGFVNAWNETCTQPGGAERAKGLKLLGVI